jgi:hypothetical protein
MNAPKERTGLSLIIGERGFGIEDETTISKFGRKTILFCVHGENACWILRLTEALVFDDVWSLFKECSLGDVVEDKREALMSLHHSAQVCSSEHALIHKSEVAKHRLLQGTYQFSFPTIALAIEDGKRGKIKDENVARLVRLRSQERNGRPVGVLDDLIRQIQARQKSAAPPIHRASSRREDEDTVTGNDRLGEEASSSRRHKKRGGSTRNKHQEGAVPSHLHLMYREDDESASSREREDEERDAHNV